MGRRGRRPHPDILTPREWEVLDLLRERLTNEQIAERLGITLDGAKYHVSQILSKLGVATREDAGAWQPEEQRQWWQRLIALPVAAKIAGAATLIAAGAGIVLLTWSVFATETTEERDALVISWTPPSLPKPLTEPRLTRDQALARGGGGDGEIAWVDAQASELGAILRYLDGPLPPEIPELAGRSSKVTAWLIITVGEFPPPDRGPRGSEPPVVPEIACRRITRVFWDPETQTDPTGGPTGSYSVGNPLPNTLCDRGELTRDLAIVYGKRAVADRIMPFLEQAQVYASFPREVPAERMTLGKAVERIEQESMVNWQLISTFGDDLPVWLLHLRRPFIYSLQTAPKGADGRLCARLSVIIDAHNGEPVRIGEGQPPDC